MNLLAKSLTLNPILSLVMTKTLQVGSAGGFFKPSSSLSWLLKRIVLGTAEQGTPRIGFRVIVSGLGIKQGKRGIYLPGSLYSRYILGVPCLEFPLIKVMLNSCPEPSTAAFHEIWNLKRGTLKISVIPLVSCEVPC